MIVITVSIVDRGLRDLLALAAGWQGVRPALGPTLKSGGEVTNQSDCTYKSASVFDLWSPPEVWDSMFGVSRVSRCRMILSPLFCE